MATFRYPQNDLDSPEILLNLLGSFWASVYQGNDVVQDLMTTTGQIVQQTYIQLLELLNSVSRQDISVFHKEDWYALTIQESELNSSESLQARYNTGYVYDNGLQYNQKMTGTMYAVQKPAGLEAVSVIFNRITVPSVEYIINIDFELTPDLILFRENPFANPLVPKVEKLDNSGAVVDRECVLWLYRGDWDKNYLYDQFGYALKLNLKSSDAYKVFINAILDALVEGTSQRTQQLALAAIFGVPLVMETQETVEHVLRTDLLTIITDQHVYQFPLESQATVTAGMTVYAGDTLTDAFQIFEPHRGEQIDPAFLQALTLEPGVLGAGYWQGITFENQEKQLKVEPDVEGYTKVSWELGGFTFDVEKFWADVHKKGISKNQTLAMLLDKRENPTTQPFAGSLPATINPLQFLADNYLRSNTFIVRLKSAINGLNRLAYIPVSQLHKILPPHTLMLLIIEFVFRDTPVSMEGPGNAEQTGYNEAISTFPCLTRTETIEATGLTESIRSVYIRGRCV